MGTPGVDTRILGYGPLVLELPGDTSYILITTRPYPSYLVSTPSVPIHIRHIYHRMPLNIHQ